VPLEPGTVWVARGPTGVLAAPGGLLVAYAGSEIRF